ncbi:MAG TPA: NAD(P)/FAD-dependent oxidoreductase [Anaerolineales bacterium]|nr:NAD(P)/FAD-dependent oxidoreductase [Anaerolineales bacterium]
MPEQPISIAILGAGFGGLAAAYDLVRAGHKVTIYEASDHPGGLASGFKEPHWDWSVEQFYHHWFASDQHMLGLINELGWQDKVVYPRPYTVMYHKGKFYPFDAIPQMALYPGLGWGLNKIRFGFVGLYLKLTNNWQALEQHTVDAWMRKWAGNKVYETMWEPMMIGKFGEHYASQVNMAWLWARIKARTTRLGTYTGGFQAFSDQLAAHLQSLGVEIRYDTAVNQVTPAASGTLDLATTQGLAHHDRCLVTTSPSLMAKIAPVLPPSYLRGLLDLKHMGAVVMVLALKQRLSEQGYYWYNMPKSAGFPFLALVEHTNFLKPEYFGGDHIVYCGDYLENDHEYFSLSQEALLERFLPSFERINPQFKPDWVRKAWLFRSAYAQPIPLLNHSQNIPAIQTPIPGLYFASMSQVYPWDRGTNFAVEIGRRAARMILQSTGQA